MPIGTFSIGMKHLLWHKNTVFLCRTMAPEIKKKFVTLTRKIGMGCRRNCAKREPSHAVIANFYARRWMRALKTETNSTLLIQHLIFYCDPFFNYAERIPNSNGWKVTRNDVLVRPTLVMGCVSTVLDFLVCFMTHALPRTFSCLTVTANMPIPNIEAVTF